MTDIVKESLSSYKQELGKLEDRVNSMETKLIQNDLVIYGLKSHMKLMTMNQTFKIKLL